MKDNAATPRKGDETFQFLALGFNIRRALEIVGTRPPNATVVPRNVSQLIRIDEVYAMSDAVDILKPVIVATLPGRYGTLLIDGYHRAYKAAARDAPLIPAHCLSVEDSRACCWTPDAWTVMVRASRKEQSHARTR